MSVQEEMDTITYAMSLGGQMSMETWMGCSHPEIVSMSESTDTVVKLQCTACKVVGTIPVGTWGKQDFSDQETFDNIKYLYGEAWLKQFQMVLEGRR